MPEKRAYAVIDTNILVSALWTENPESPPVKIIDCVFYAVTLAARKKHDARLVTGNTKHFPQKEFVVTAREFLNLLETDCV